MSEPSRRSHLSVADVLMLNVDVERVIAIGSTPTSLWTPQSVKRFAATIVPLFKYAMVNGHVDRNGHPLARIPWPQWMDAVPSDTKYVKLREAFGWFVSAPDKPMATLWLFGPPLTR